MGRFDRWMVLLTLAVFGCDAAPDGGASADVGVDAAGGGGAGGGGGEPTDARVADAAPTCLSDDECPAEQYCVPVNQLDGVCVVGCRRAVDGQGPGNCEGRTLCSEDHVCVQDPHCIDDTECEDQNTWCQDGDCVPGCRPDPENCLPDEEGRARQCNPTTRACERLVACCDGDCAIVRDGACGAPVPGVFSCFVEDLCDLVCQSDANCADGFYCGDGLCAPGCRANDAESCPDQRCDEVSRACVPNPCESDRDCARDQFCAPDGCLAGCRVDPDNCPAGQACGENRLCRATGNCIDDAQCERDNGPGWRCLGESCERVCAADGECGAGEYCDAGTCVAGCRDDGLEENDDQASATPLAVVDGMIFRGEPVVACDLDHDWYSFSTARGYGARVSIRFRDNRGDLDLRLHPPEGNPVTSAGQVDDETVTIRDVAAGGTWFVEVYSRGLDTNEYRVEVELLPPGGCVPDVAEAQGDDGPVGAFAVQVPGLQDVQLYAARTVCGADEDWYRLPLGNGDGLRVELTVENPAAPPLDLAIYGPGLPAAGVEPTFTPNGGNATTLSFDAPRPSPQIAGGDWYIRVWNPQGEGGTSYDLRVSVDRVRALCLSDAAEPNANAGNAFDLMQVRAFTRAGLDGVRELLPDADLDLEDLWLCAGDEDWYSFDARAGDDLAISVVRLDPVIEGDVAVEIRDAQGAIVGEPGQGANALNTARAADLARGRYFIRVAGLAPTTQTRHTLRIERAAGPVACVPDRYEAAPGNGARATAAAVRDGVIEGLTLCGGGGDEDWYAVTLDGVSDLTVRTLFSQLQADLDVDVFQGDAVVAENADSLAGHSLDDDEEVALPNRLPGVWYIRVRANDGGDARYTLEIEVSQRAFLCMDDPDEPNDSSMLATDLGAGAVDRDTQWICDRVPAEVDTFRFRVPGGVSRTVAATFVYGDDGDLVIEVQNGQGQVVATTAGISRELSKQCITIPPFVADRSLVLRVVPLSINRVLDDDEQLDYRLRILAGADCELVQPLTPGVRWPAVPPPN